MNYFSYGSNMSIRRLRARVPSARKIATGILKQHALRFHKHSDVDGSAKCDAHETGDLAHVVHGVIFEISEHEKHYLDKAEGLGQGYEIKDVILQLDNGTEVEAFTYYATHINPLLKPFDWYREHVLTGALENDLPAYYVREIEVIEFDFDDNDERRDLELSIYK